VEEIKHGEKIVVVAGEHSGKVGTSRTNRVSSRLVHVRLQSGKMVKVPRANVRRAAVYQGSRNG
jgi:hypothetical protein